MEIAPPQDEELRNIIDKLAVFVARNGPDFESMTKQKQQGNARFQFLYGGEYYDYYMHRVQTERRNVQQPQQQRPVSLMGQFVDFPGEGGGGHQMQRNIFDQQPRMQTPPPRHISRFDRGPPGQSPGQFQNFERPPMRMPFQQQQQQSFGGHFDQGRGSGNFEEGRRQNNFDQGRGSGDFDQNTRNTRNFEEGRMSGNFDQGRGGGRNFEDGRISGNFEQARVPGLFDQQSRGPAVVNYDHGRGQPDFNPGHLGGVGPNFESVPTRNPFETRVPGRNRFDIGPSGGFEGPPHSHQGFGSGFQHQQNPTPVVTAPPVIPMKSLATITAEIEDLNKQKASLEKQIKQSEQNLAAQNQVLMTQQQQQIEEAILILQDAEIKQLVNELNINLVELDGVLEPIIESCTKESISSGNAWIFTHTSTPRHYKLLSMYLLKKTTDPESTFSQRLHIIYLVNDVLHHCMRKGAEDLRQVLEAMVIPMFSHASVKEIGNEERLAKLNKLLTLWESKCQYVSQIAVEKLKDASNTWLEYHSELMKRHAVVVTQIAQNIQKTYEGYQAQHQLFCQHILNTIKTLEPSLQQLTLLQQQQQQQMALINQPPPMNLQNAPLIANIPPPGLVIPTGLSSGPVAGPMAGFGNGPSGPGAGFNHANSENKHIPELSLPQESATNVILPDISRPPPSDKELMPALEYYLLPAGLMVPLVKPEDDNYKPIDPKNIRLPPPCPPSEKLIQAVEAFYSAPSHERPRDSEGWERLGLYEYYKSKNLARKQKEDDIREGRRIKSKSPSPLRRDSSPSGRSPPRRRYQSKSPSPSKRRRSRSRSPTRRNKPVSRRRSRSRSKSRSPIRRSPTPPSFGMPGLGIEKKIDESNKGHQLLLRMGWSGSSGLGANEQGIEAPISGGEVRERKDLYRGVGIATNDPFESYRKIKGQKFVERMRQRAEERP